MFRILFTAIIILFSIIVSAQETKVVSDFRLKTQLAINYSPIKKLSFSCSGQAYLERDASTLDEYFLGIETKYKPFKIFHLGFGYRHTWNYSDKNEVWNGVNRFNIDALLRNKLSRFKFIYRIRIQNVDDDLFLYDDNTAITETIFRNKIVIRYNIKKSGFTPFVSAELYLNFNDEPDISNKIKCNVGTSYEFYKHHKIRSYYQLMQELTNNYPYTYHILFIGYSFYF